MLSKQLPNFYSFDNVHDVLKFLAQSLKHQIIQLLNK